MVDQHELHENGRPNKQSRFADNNNNNNNNNNNSCRSWGVQQSAVTVLNCIQFLSVFAKLRKATINFSLCLSVRPSICPSVHMEQLGFHWRDLHEITYLSIFRKNC